MDEAKLRRLDELPEPLVRLGLSVEIHRPWAKATAISGPRDGAGAYAVVRHPELTPTERAFSRTKPQHTHPMSDVDGAVRPIREVIWHRRSAAEHEAVRA